MAIQTEKSFVLKTYDLRETSKIASLFTEKSGKIKGVFKGIRAGKKNLVTTLEIGSVNEIVFYPSKSELWLVSFAEMLSANTFGANIDLSLRSTYIAEMTDCIMPLHCPSTEVYNLLSDVYSDLKDEKFAEKVPIFQIKLLDYSGFRPAISQCASCGCPLSVSMRFSCRLGGFVCVHCGKFSADSITLSAETAYAMKYIQSSNYEQARRLRLSLQAQEELKKTLEDFFMYHTGARLKSLFSVSRKEEVGYACL